MSRIPVRRAPRSGRRGRIGGAAILAALLLPVVHGCGEPPRDPIEERLEMIADPRAAQVVEGMLQAYGGYEAWRVRRNVEYTYRLLLYGGGKTPQYVTRQLHRLGLEREVQAYVEDLGIEKPQIVRLDGEHLEVTRGGKPVVDPEKLAFPETYGRIIRWSFRAPWHLIDPASRLESRAVRTPEALGTVPIGPCDVVRLRFDEPTPGGGPDDWYDYYISQRSHLVERVHSYRSDNDTYRVAIWSSHRMFDGVRVAAHRETYASDAGGNLGDLEAVTEYLDLRFDAPFKNDIFRGAFSLASPGSGEARFESE